MPTYSPISAGQIDEDSPVTTALKTAVRDNPFARRKVSVLTSNQVYTNNDTVVATGMSVSVPGGATYRICAGVKAATGGGGGAAGLRLRIVTSDPGVDQGAVYLYGKSVTSLHTVLLGTLTNGINGDVFLAPVENGVDYINLIEGYAILDATPAVGTIALWAAQHTHDADSVTAYAGSFLAVYMVDQT